MLIKRAVKSIHYRQCNNRERTLHVHSKPCSLFNAKNSIKDFIMTEKTMDRSLYIEVSLAHCMYLMLYNKQIFPMGCLIEMLYIWL